MSEINDSGFLDGLYTSSQAADVLGVSAHQVVQLIHAGELNAFRTAGGVFLVDATSVANYARLAQGRGRPFSAGVAWAALWLLSGREVDWLSYQQRRRLLMRLREVSTEELLWLVRRRARLLHLRVDESFLSVTRTKLVLSGASSRAMFDLGLTIDGGRVEGYIFERDVDDFVRSCFAVAGGNCNLVVRVMSDTMPFSLTDCKEMPVAVVGADLAASSAARERSAGLRLLEELLREWRACNE